MKGLWILVILFNKLNFTFGQVSIAAVDQPLTQNFNALATVGTSSVMPTGWVFLETGGNALYTASNGTNTNTDTYSFGTGTGTERALGEISGAPFSTMFGASFSNNTGVTLNTLLITYTGEQWRLGAIGVSDKLIFEYSTNATAINNGSWTAVTALDFSAPVTSGTVGALDGNLSANQRYIGGTITGLSISNGSTFWIRWGSTDAAGTDHGLSIDDFALVANPVADYNVSTAGSALVIDDLVGFSDVMDVTENSTFMNVYVQGRSYSLNGSGINAFPLNASIAAFNSITLNGNAGDDNFEIGAFTNSLPSLSINGGAGDDQIDLNGDINFISNANLDLDLQNDIASPGEDAVRFIIGSNISLSGTGTATVKVSESITLQDGASIETVNGNLTMEANQQGTSATGSFIGIAVINGSSVKCSGTGLLTMKGRGGTGTLAQHGLQILGGTVTAGTNGTAVLQGTGGNGATGVTSGVMVTANGLITSNGGNLEITGNGGGAASSASVFGVNVLSGGEIIGGGSGNVTITGTGGATGSAAHGVVVNGTGVSITSNGGAVSVTGIGGGTSGQAHGGAGIQLLSSGQISSGGTGTVTVNATGSPGTLVSNFGMRMVTGTITSSGGSVSVTCTGGGSGTAATATGLSIETSSIISAGGSGTVTVIGNGGAGSGNNKGGVSVASGSTITSSGGHVSVTGTGGGTGSANNSFGVGITSGTITAGGNGTISILGTGGPGLANTSPNYGVILNSSNSTITSSGGNINIAGFGGGNGTTSINQHGVAILNGASVTATASASITITGNGGSGNTGSNYGVSVAGSSAVVSSVDGNINITGTGGNSTGAAANNIGINANTASITTTGAGFIILNGTGGQGTGDGHIGILFGNSVSMSTAAGDIDFHGIGGGNDGSAGDYGISIISSSISTALSGHIDMDGESGACTGNNNIGINIADSDVFTVNGAFISSGHSLATGTSAFSYGIFITSSEIYSTGNGAIVLLGIGGEGNGNNNIGLYLENAATHISTINGNITLQGNGGGAGAADLCYGIYCSGATIESTGSGNLLLFGVGGNGSGILNIGTFLLSAGTEVSSNTGGIQFICIDFSGIGLSIDSGVPVMSAAGDITITSNSLSISGTVTTSATNEIYIKQQTNNVQVVIDTSDAVAGGPLHLSDGVLDVLNAGTIVIGNNNTGNITIGSDITRASATHLQFISSQDIIINGGAINANGGNVRFDPGNSPDAAHPLQAGTEIVCDTFRIDGALEIHVDGPIAESGYEQLSVEGKINLTGTSLLWTTTYTPTYLDSFLIVINDGVDPFIGTFVELAEGATIPMFLGSNLAATISYLGGDGNDVVVRIPIPNYSITTTGNQLIITNLTNNADNVTISENGNNIRFAIPGRNYSLNGNVFANFPVDISLAGLTSITINNEGGDDINTINAFVNPLPSLTINGGTGSESIIFSGNVHFQPGANLDLDLLNDGAASELDGISLINGANVVLSGSGEAIIRISAMFITAGTSLVTHDGNLLIEANYQEPIVTGNFNGLTIQGLLQVTGAGNLTAKGRAGQSASSRNGVYLEDGGDILGGPTGLTIVEGKGTPETNTPTIGVLLTDAGSTITSAGGNVQVIGYGGGAAGASQSHGVSLMNGSQISAGGNGSVMVNGTGGTGTGTTFIGVRLFGTNTSITSNNGPVTVIGTGGTSATAVLQNGVNVLAGSFISAGGTASVIVTGMGGPGSSNQQYGVLVSGALATITSSGGDVSVTGTGGGSGGSVTNNGVMVTSGGLITAGNNGNVVVNGTGGLGNGDSHYGIFINASTITSNNGNVTIAGQGGGSNTAPSGHGVVIASGGIVSAGGVGMVSVTGTGNQNTAGNMNYGVWLRHSNSMITSSGGNITVNGQGGGTGSSSSNFGVFVETGAKITAANTGTVLVTGAGGHSGGTSNHGVLVFSTNALITSSGGNVTVNGQGGGTGASPLNYGVAVEGPGRITAGNGGSVNVTGLAGVTTGNANYGVLVNSAGATITSNGGPVTVNGTGGGTGASASGIGVHIANGGVISSGGTGTISITGTGGNGNGNFNVGISLQQLNSKVFSNGGNITLTGFGGGSTSSFINYGIYLSAGGLVTASGNGSVTFHGTGGNGSQNYGVYLNSTDMNISTTNGNIQVTGTGGGSGTSGLNYGVLLSGKVLAGGAGQVIINGTGGDGTGESHGVYVLSSSSLISTAGGNITINGIGGATNTSGSYGVYLNAGKITATGNALINITGTGGAGVSISNHGMRLNAAAMISSANGNITLTGIGGAASAFNTYGILVENSSTIVAGGNGELLLTGTGGNCTGANCYGIWALHEGTILQANDGDLKLMGTGGGVGTSVNGFGVYVSNNAKLLNSGNGTIEVTGQGGPGTGGSNYGVWLNSTGVHISGGVGGINIVGHQGSGVSGLGFVNTTGLISTGNSGGEIEIGANSMFIGSGISTNHDGLVKLHPMTAGTDIQITALPDVIGTSLRLSDAELDFIQTGHLHIGHELTDTISIEMNVTRPDTTDIILQSMSKIMFNTGTISTATGELYLDCGDAPHGVRATTFGPEINASLTTIDDVLLITINGIVADSDYIQLNLLGQVNITDANLFLNGFYVPEGGEIFTIIANDDTEPVIGTFGGLMEGDTIFNFLGTTLKAVISYQGNDGNDVTLRVVSPCAFPDIPVILASQDTICEGTQITLSITSGNLGGATDWHWYAGACGSDPSGTGTSIMVNPSESTTYYARGEGGCVTNSICGNVPVVVNQRPDATIQYTADSDCYFTENIFQPAADSIPGASYQWDFGADAVPATASGYGPHSVMYNSAGTKTIKLVINPNQPGASCPDSSTLNRDVIVCLTQILGRVQSVTGAPIVNVNIRLFEDANLDGMADNSTVIRNVFTPANGNFTMANITPGSYVIVQTQPSNWFSYDDGDTSDDSDLVPNSDSLDNIIPVTLTASEVDSMNLFIETPSPGQINGIVFDDLNLNQVPDSGEGLENVTIQLFADLNLNGVADSGTPIATVVTNSDGNYHFSNVATGHYVLAESQPMNFVSIKDFDATNDGDLVPNTNMQNDTLPVTIVNGENDAQNFFIDAQPCGLVVTNTADDGLGSLRQAMTCAQPGDTILFHPSLSGMTITINSTPLTVSQNLTFLNALSPRVTIQSAINGLFEITSGIEATFVDLKIISGLSPGGTGAAFENQGILTLQQTHVIRNPSFSSGEYLINNYPGSELRIEGTSELRMEE